MTDPKDDLLAEAARLLDNATVCGDERWEDLRTEWLSRYEAHRKATVVPDVQAAVKAERARCHIAACEAMAIFFAGNTLKTYQRAIADAIAAREGSGKP